LLLKLLNPFTKWEKSWCFVLIVPDWQSETGATIWKASDLAAVITPSNPKIRSGKSKKAPEKTTIPNILLPVDVPCIAPGSFRRLQRRTLQPDPRVVFPYERAP
jgi:hypothetical protein